MVSKIYVSTLLYGIPFSFFKMCLLNIKGRLSVFGYVVTTEISIENFSGR